MGVRQGGHERDRRFGHFAVLCLPLPHGTGDNA